MCVCVHAHICVCDEMSVSSSLQALWALTRWGAINNMLLLIDKLRTVAEIYDTSQKTNLCCFVAERRRQATHKRAVSPSHNAAPMSAEFSPLQPWVLSS